MSYLRPSSLDAVVQALGAGARPLAGGTDVYPGASAQVSGPVVDLTGVPALRGVTETAEGLRIGACTTWSDLAEGQLPAACLGLQQAARQIGGRQIQNAGTIGGNLCNASPAADGVPPLLVLGAKVELASASGLRRLPLADFILGARQTALRPDELLTALHLPSACLSGRSAFVKLGARAYLVISIAMVAVRLVAKNGLVTQADVAVGACSAVARRLPDVEAALLGPVLTAADRVDPSAVAAALDPIDDVRATAAYRRLAAAELLCRAVAEALA